MLNVTCTASDHRASFPRKLRLDRALYCLHSMRASGGESGCDHDFELAPTVKRADCAVWICTRCGRAFRYESWKTDAQVASRQSSRSFQNRDDEVASPADGALLFCDPKGLIDISTIRDR